MEEEKAPEERRLIKIEEMNLEETQIAEQLYNSAGLGPVVDAGLKDYDQLLQKEDKLISKVFGARGSDIKGYGESVAKRVAFAVYALLNKQYGGKVGDLRSYIMTLEDERNRANTRYDELMGRVVGILGEEYKELRTDSKEYMERLTTVLGEDLKESKIDKKALAESLADIDGLRQRIKDITTEKERQKEQYESQIAILKSEHDNEVKDLRSQINDLDSAISSLDLEKTNLSNDLAQLKKHNDQLSATITALTEAKEQQKETYESQIVVMKSEHDNTVKDLSSQISEMDAKINNLDLEKTNLSNDLAQLREDYNQLKAAISTLTESVPNKEIGVNLAGGLYDFVLKDSKAPNLVIKGVGQFIDFRKYLGLAAERGAKEAVKQAEGTLRSSLRE